MFRVGIVGVGNIAQTAHLPAYEKLTDRVQIVAVADINFERAKEVGAKLGVPAYDSVEALLAGTEVDYVDICCWNGGHAPVAIAAARAGKAILCEKPMAVDLPSALAMEAAVKEAGVPFMVAVVTRYTKEAQAAHRMQEEGVLGEVIFAKATYTRRRGTPIGWFTDSKKSGGGPVIDIGVHCIDRSWFLMGRPRPVSVSATTSYAIGNFRTKGITRWTALDAGDGTFDTEDSATAFVRFENGAALFAEIAWAQNMPEANEVVLYGTKGGVRFDPLTLYTENEDGLADLQPTVEGDNDMFRNEIAHFLDCLETGAEPMSSVADGVAVQRILDGIYRSAKEGKEVTL